MSPTAADASSLEYADLVKRTEVVRAGIERPLSSSGAVKALLAQLDRSGLTGDYLPARNLRDDLEDFLSGTTESDRRLRRVKSWINAGASNFMLSAFHATYFPDLSLEALIYDPLVVNGALARKYETNVVAANIVASTAGFTPIVVALFPENHLDGMQAVGDRIFYWVDRFVSRFTRVTRPLLEFGVERDAFPLLADLSQTQIEKAVVYWVWLHEYFHRQGPMPLPGSLSVKSYKPLAGLEECRVDMRGLLTLYHDRDLPSDERAVAWQFILAERLLRYATEGIPNPNYDAVGSQILFTFLRERNYIALRNGRLLLGANLVTGIEEFVDHVETIEASVERHGSQVVKQRLVEFSRRFTNYDASCKVYRHDPFFLVLKEQLSSALRAETSERELRS